MCMSLHHLWKIPGTGHQGYLERLLGDVTHWFIMGALEYKIDG